MDKPRASDRGKAKELICVISGNSGRGSGTGSSMDTDNSNSRGMDSHRDNMGPRNNISVVAGGIP
jgi:hypothetical protein